MKNIITLAAILLAIPTLILAAEKEDELISKVTAAYGGEALVNLENYRIEEHYLSATIGQSHSPSLNEIGQTSQILIVDIKNNAASFENWSGGRGGSFQGATLSNGEEAWTINYQANTYGLAGNADPHVFAGGTMRTSDAILVYQLNKVKDKVELLDDEDYMNRAHHVLSMPFPSSPDLKLYIDAKTFLVSKMQRNNPQLGNLDYVYSDYQTHNGIRFAASTNFFVAGTANLTSTKRAITFNQALADNTFKLDENLEQESARIDTSEMLLNKLSERVSHVGQGNAYSLFVNTNIGTVAIGAYGGLEARYRHYQKASDNFKPLEYQIITHHHSDHIGGVAEAVSLGAKLVTVNANIATIRAGVTPSPTAGDFFSVANRATFGEGRDRVELYEISTIHAQSFLVSYIPTIKTIFIADHFGSPFEKGIPTARQSTVDMLNALNELNLDVAKIATAHNARIFTMKELRESVAAFEPSQCAANRPVCS